MYGEGIAEFIDEAIKAFCGVKQMIREVMHDPIFLAGKSEIATKDDLQVAQDLLDTLMAHRDGCVGMAANMIGMRKRIIAFLDESGRAPTYMVMLNPEIIKKTVRIAPRRGVYLFSVARDLANAINLSRLNIRPWICRLESKPTPDGRHRLFSMKSITVKVF